jgi:hypothetical protein
MTYKTSYIVAAVLTASLLITPPAKADPITLGIIGIGALLGGLVVGNSFCNKGGVNIIDNVFNDTPPPVVDDMVVGRRRLATRYGASACPPGTVPCGSQQQALARARIAQASLLPPVRRVAAAPPPSRVVIPQRARIEEAVRKCMQKYPSYNPNTGLITTSNGMMALCPFLKIG